MIWHIVRFHFPEDVDDSARRALEDDIAALSGTVDELVWLAVGRDVDDPAVTGLLTVFEDAEGLAVYRDHPRHVPVAQRARELSDAITRIDMEAGLPSAGG